MRQAVSTRQSNIDATLDARDDQVSKTNQRAVSRTLRTPGRVLAYIAWNLTASGVDTSLGVICNENGKSTFVTISIDAVQSILNCRPQLFGYALYEVSICGIRTASPGLPVYAAVRASEIKPDSSLGVAKALGSIDSSNRLLDTTGALIQVTVAGSATNSVLVPTAPSEIIYTATAALNLPVNITPPQISYGIVRWNYTQAGGDESEAEVCLSSGTRIGSPQTVAIDFLSSIRPQIFGNVAYKLELIGVRSTTPLYRAIETVFIPLDGSAAPPREFYISGAGVTDANGAVLYPGYVCSSASGYPAISTTISGTAVDNYLELLAFNNGPTTGAYIDLPLPLTWSISGIYGSAAYVCLIPAIVVSHRVGGILGTNKYFDSGETIVLPFVGGLSVAPSGNAMTSGTIVFQITGAGTCSGYIVGFGYGTQYNSAVPPAPTPFGLTYAGISGANIFTNISFGSPIASVTTSYGGFNVIINATGSIGKWTGINIAASSPTGSITTVSLGGVPIGGQGPGWLGVG